MPHLLHDSSNNNRTTTAAATPPPPSQVLPQHQLPVGERFWNANLPQQKWTEECPDFLLGLGQKNVGILSAPEDAYHYLSWPEAKELVESNRIDHFQRSPLALRKYLLYMFKLKQKYGSVLSFVQSERLHWNSISPSADPFFTNSADYKILYNDWPYGLDSQITHLVVWTKFLLDDEPETGLLTQESYDMIEQFVTNTFCGPSGVKREDLIWFKNWRSLKSVHALEHFHIMLYRAPKHFLKAVTNGDTPMSDMVSGD